LLHWGRPPRGRQRLQRIVWKSPCDCRVHRAGASRAMCLFGVAGYRDRGRARTYMHPAHRCEIHPSPHPAAHPSDHIWNYPFIQPPCESLAQSAFMRRDDTSQPLGFAHFGMCLVPQVLLWVLVAHELLLDQCTNMKLPMAASLYLAVTFSIWMASGALWLRIWQKADAYKRSTSVLEEGQGNNRASLLDRQNSLDLKVERANRDSKPQDKV